MTLANDAAHSIEATKANRPYVIGVTGGSASGKTTVATKLSELLADFRPVVLHQDRYFRDFSTLSPEEFERQNTANKPESILWPELLDSVRRLIARQPVTEPMPGTRAAARRAEVIQIVPGDVLIIEGLFALWDEWLRAQLDLKIFVEVDDDERLLRRLARDLIERDGTVPGVISWYRKDVAPNFPKFTGQTRQVADVIVPNNRACDTAVRLIAAGVRQTIRERSGAER